jgi:hypothetical protein
MRERLDVQKDEKEKEKMRIEKQQEQAAKGEEKFKKRPHEEGGKMSSRVPGATYLPKTQSAVASLPSTTLENCGSVRNVQASIVASQNKRS